MSVGAGASAFDVDVVIVGAGPAGATAALNLAPFRRVLLVDRQAEPAPRIGESLPAAAGRLLADMGLLSEFLADGHAPNYGNRSVWGSAYPIERDSLRDLDGPGWRLDRRRFELQLRRVAVTRGATLVTPARLLAVERNLDGFMLCLERAGQRRAVTARAIIDASGRNAVAVRRFGAQRVKRDRLVCGWLYGTRCEPTISSAKLVYTESEAQGWWYSAALPNAQRVLAFHTDSDLPAAASLCSVPKLLARVARLPELSQLIKDARFDASARVHVCAAHSASLEPAVGPGWFATGDAALSFDPLSSQGLFNALFTGLAVAEAAERSLSGDDTARAEYAATLRDIDDANRRGLREWYALERRFSNSRFWQRRRSPMRFGAEDRSMSSRWSSAERFPRRE